MSDQSAADASRCRRHFVEWVLERIKGTTNFRYPFTIILTLPITKAEDVHKYLKSHPDCVASDQFGGVLTLSLEEVPEQDRPKKRGIVINLRIRWSSLEDVEPVLKPRGSKPAPLPLSIPNSKVT